MRPTWAADRQRRALDGNISFSILVSGAAPDGWSVTATATNPGGSTSEFSACVTAAEVSPPPDDGEYEWHYQYDDLSRVTYACSDGWTGSVCAGDEFHYRYDGAGNLTRFDKWNADTGQVETVRYVINDANQIQCIDADASGDCNASETEWEYDRYGNLLDDGTTTYEYDTTNRLIEIANATSNTSYIYNGDGDRIAQNANGTLTTYILDTATPLTMVLSETTTGQTTQYWHGLDTLAQSDGTTTEYFAYDGLGSVRQLVDTGGEVQLTQTFDPYGTGYAKAGSAGSSFGYSGEQVDANGFIYLRARYYNPAYGRFFQRDTFRGNPNYPLTLNPYMFVLGNPILHVDPSGMCIFTGLDTAICAMLAAAGVGALVGAAASIGMYALACLGACGCEIEDWAKNITLPEFVFMVALSAGMGALAGALVLAAPLVAPILGVIGAGFSIADMIQHGVTWCNAIGLIASIAGGLAGATAPVPKSIRFNPSFVTNLGSTASLFRGWSISVTWTAVTVIPADYAGVVSAPLVLALAGGPGGGLGGSGSKRPTNRDGVPYPKQNVESYGEVPFPDGKIKVIEKPPLRGKWTAKLRSEFRAWWYGKYGWYPSPDKYNIHHILPLSRGGTNDFENLVPLRIGHEHNQFTKWWLKYP